MSELTYTQAGDYLLLNLNVEETTQGEPGMIGQYGLMRKHYLREHRVILYNSLLLRGKLADHLKKTDRTANERIERTMDALIEQNPPPDKAANQMAWVAHMNSLQRQAEEMVLYELIYS